MRRSLFLLAMMSMTLAHGAEQETQYSVSTGINTGANGGAYSSFTFCLDNSLFNGTAGTNNALATAEPSATSFQSSALDLNSISLVWRNLGSSYSGLTMRIYEGSNLLFSSDSYSQSSSVVNTDIFDSSKFYTRNVGVFSFAAGSSISIGTTYTAKLFDANGAAASLQLFASTNGSNSSGFAVADNYQPGGLVLKATGVNAAEVGTLIHNVAELEPYRGNMEGSNNALTLAASLDVDGSNSAAWWANNVPLLSGGHISLNALEGQELAIRNGTGVAFLTDKCSSSQPFQSSLALDGLAKLSFSNNSSSYSNYSNSNYVAGNSMLSSCIVVDSYGRLSLQNNGEVLFSQNSNIGSDAYPYSDTIGGAINIYEGSQAEISHNGAVSFVGNVASSTKRSASGGAIYLGGFDSVLNMKDNASLLFEKNSVGNAVYSASGGAIYAASRSTLLLDGTRGDVSFLNNSATANLGSTANAYGGAVASSSSFTISNTEGSVLFKDNSVSACAAAQGGAIYSTNKLSISGNKGDISFVGNSISSSATSGRKSVHGGAISLDFGSGSLVIADNAGSVLFQGNHIASGQEVNSNASGGAIYSSGSIRITGNGDVSFRSNWEQTGKSYLLRSIVLNDSVSAGANFDLSASAGKSISFYDSISVAKSIASGGSAPRAYLNAAYAENGSRSVNAQAGSIIFSGAYTAEDLQSIKGSAATESELTASRHSTIAGQTSLYGGSLVICDEAVLSLRGLDIVAGSNASLKLDNGTLDSTGYALSFSSGSSLQLSGHNSLSASAISLANGVNLDFALTADSLDNALLDLSLGEGCDVARPEGVVLNLNLSGLDSLKHAGAYKLISLSGIEGGDFSSWTADSVRVTGAEAKNLVWENGVLSYHVWETVDAGDNYSQSGTAGDAPANVTVKDDANFTLDSKLNGAEEGSPQEGIVNGDIVIESGSATVTAEGAMDGSLVFQGEAEDTRSLNVEKEGFSVKEVRVDADAAINVAGDASASVQNLSGEAALSKSGEGTLQIGGESQVKAQLSVSGGELQLVDNAALAADSAKISQAGSLKTESGFVFSVNDTDREASMSNVSGVAAGSTELGSQKGQMLAEMDNMQIAVDAESGEYRIGDMQLFSSTIISDAEDVKLTLCNIALDAMSSVISNGSVITMEGNNSLHIAAQQLQAGYAMPMALFELEQTQPADIVNTQFSSVSLAEGASLAITLSNSALEEAGITGTAVYTLLLQGLTTEGENPQLTLTLGTLGNTDSEISLLAVNTLSEGTMLSFRVSQSPEPTTGLLALLGLAGLAARRRRK